MCGGQTGTGTGLSLVSIIPPVLHTHVITTDKLNNFYRLSEASNMKFE
jgi:hypothetical protein